MERRDEFSESISKRINEVLALCKANQDDDHKSNPAVIDMDLDAIDLKSLDTEWTDKENTLVAVDPLKATIASRAVLKILKIGSVMSVFNDTGGKLGFKEFTWAQNAVTEEFNNINLAVRLSDSTDIDAVISHVAIPAITQILAGMYKDSKTKVPKKVVGLGIFSKSNFYAAVRKNTTIKSMGSDVKGSFKPVSGVAKVLDAMIDQGYLLVLTDDEVKRFSIRGPRGSLYKITPEFKWAVDELEN